MALLLKIPLSPNFKGLFGQGVYEVKQFNKPVFQLGDSQYIVGIRSGDNK